MKKAIPAVLTFFCAGCFALQPNPQFTSVGKGEGTTGENSGTPQYVTPHFESLLKEAIRSYYGAPYEWGGLSYQGIDCSGLVMNVYSEAVNISLPRNTEAMFREGVEVPRRNLRFGDLVFFKDVEEYGISHVGIYLGDEMFVHSTVSQGVTEDNINSSYYLKRYVGARRIYTH